MKPLQPVSLIGAALVGLGLAAGAARAQEAPQVTLILKDHRFSPEKITVPAGTKVRILLINQDSSTEEFDSVDLGKEEDVTPHGRTTFSIGPLKPGDYSFMGELHPQSAGGVVTAVAGSAAAANGAREP